MIDTKELRRLAEEQQWIGRWYDAGCETLMAERNGEHEEVAHLTPIGLVPYLVAVQPAATTELLDRLEAAEKDIALKERIIDSLGSTLNAVANERDALRAAVCHEADCVEACKAEVETLLARIEVMEKQGPIAWTTQLALELGSSALGFDACRGNLWGDKGIPLYTLPGAQPEPSVPTGFVWPECPKRRQSHVLFDDGYEEGWAKCVATMKEMLAAAPEAKP